MESSLVDQAIAIAKANGYAPYTTTIRAAWTEAIRSLTDALAGFCRRGREGPPGPHADVDYRSDAAFSTMRMVARKHRAQGITLELYLGLFKHFRRMYLAAFGSAALPEPTRAGLIDLALDFFDESELSITGDWKAAAGEHRLEELQARARSLTLAKDRYVAIFESLRYPAFLLDRSGALVHANKAAIDLFVGEGEAGDGIYLHDRRDLMASLEAIVEGLPDRDAEAEHAVWMNTVAGRRYFDVRLRPLQDAVGNTALGHLVQFYDVTAYRRAAEQAQGAEQQMSRFLATMSHEIRTPLHSVLGAAELLRTSGGADDDAYLDVIQNAGQSLLQTLNNVLDFTKMETGPPTPRPLDTELGPAVEAVCAMAAVAPATQRSKISLEIAPDVPLRVRLDWAMTRQVLINLLSNAVRHGEGSAIRLHVTIARDDPSGHTLRFDVSDRGPGFPSDVEPVFHLPFKEAKANHTRQGGTGLGLAISRYLVSAMSGRIGLDKPAVGARIWFEVPFRAPVQEDSKATADAETAVPSGRRCLLVDDDKIGALVSEHQLTQLGFDVDRVGTLAEAKVMLDRASYDAVVVDYLLPDGTGPEVLNTVQRNDPAAGTRVVALTANAESLNVREELRSRFHAVLAKPTDLATLSRALQGGSSSTVEPGCVGVHPSQGLEGLSPATVSAMAAAFSLQWQEFRERLAALRHGAPGRDLADLAHRLAGTTAQLGLPELEVPLREMERRCRGDRRDCDALLSDLDRPLEDVPSWHRLSL